MRACWKHIIKTFLKKIKTFLKDFQKYSISNSDNEIKEAERIDQVLQPVHKSLFIESNPCPVKYAAKILGLCNDDVRLPLVKVTEKTQQVIRNTLSSAKLI